MSKELKTSAETRAKYIKRQADFVRGLIAESTLFDAPVNMDDPDEVLVAAFCHAGVMDLSDAPADQHNNTI